MQKQPYKTDQNNPTIQAYIDAVEKGKKDQHIVPTENGWVITNLLSQKTSKTFTTTEEALKQAVSLATPGTTVFIHGQDGLIVERKDY